MPRKHALVVAVALAIAIVLGGFAAMRSAALSSSAQTTSTASITQRAHRLDRAERQLKAALARKPPALPAISSHSSSQGRATRVEYVRPAPIVITRPSASREHEAGDDHGERHGGHGEDD